MLHNFNPTKNRINMNFAWNILLNNKKCYRLFFKHELNFLQLLKYNQDVEYNKELEQGFNCLCLRFPFFKFNIKSDIDDIEKYLDEIRFFGELITFSAENKVNRMKKQIKPRIVNFDSHSIKNLLLPRRYY